MTDIPNPLLESVTLLESAMFRAGHVARRLLAEHLDLTVRSASVFLHSYADVYRDSEPSAEVKLEVRAESLEGALAWAKALNVEPSFKTSKLAVTPGESQVYEHAKVAADVDGVEISVRGSRRLTDDESAAWHAEQGPTAEGGGR